MVIRGADDDGFEIFSFEQPAVVEELFGLRESPCGGVEGVLIDIAKGDDILAGDPIEIPCPAAADTDRADI
jgi:hypothetical protein